MSTGGRRLQHRQMLQVVVTGLFLEPFRLEYAERPFPHYDLPWLDKWSGWWLLYSR